MKLTSGVFLLLIASCTTSVPQQPHPRAAEREPATPATTPPREPSWTPTMNDRYIQPIAQRIAGQKETAEKVFQNIQIPWLKDVPADNLLDIMNYGYSRALGVSCTHCHVEQDFGSDDKRPKRAAREMAVMHHAVNDQLRSMKNLETPPDKRPINCWTCHRGTIKPNQANR